MVVFGAFLTEAPLTMIPTGDSSQGFVSGKRGLLRRVGSLGSFEHLVGRRFAPTFRRFARIDSQKHAYF